MKQIIIIAVVGIVGIGAGFAGGMFFANTKSKAVIADMQTRMQQEQNQAQERLNGYDMMISTLNNELQKATLEIEKLKTPVSVITQQVPAASEVKEMEFEQPDGPTSAYATKGNDTNTKLYKIQSGDSLWSIAQKQLGNGSRFKEILKLNPKLTEKSNLVVGLNINIPAR
ncbi:MAG: LysM domain/BON superfamily protein [Planctomycetes bacterium ADurb.Bin401]|nr:MAG: LysM domain/BON superfamily protein [Planctomycetes bacterium ADurb.Bin401]